MKNTLIITMCVLGIFSQSASAKEIYVAKNGNDSADGSLNAPYLTLAKAAAEARPGDRVNIRGGTYEETLRPQRSGTEGKPIVFESFLDEKVIISAMQSLSNWTSDTGAVYSTQVDWDMGQANFVMQGETAMDLARWPNNTDGDPFTQNTLRNTGGSSGSVANNAYLDYAPGIPNIDWSKGGSIYFYGDKPGSGWIAWREYITWNNSTRLGFNLNKNPTWIRTFHAPADKGDFFLQGVRGALDYQNEWYLDASSKRLYVQLPNGVKPKDGQVKMRRRSLAVDLHNRNHIEIKNLAVFGGGINVTGSASNNKIFGISSFYGNHTLGVVSGFLTQSQSVKLEGSNNVLEHSEVAFGSGSGVFDAGNNNKILNSYIHDFNTLGSYDAALMMRNGKNTLVKNNRISRAGRDTVQAFNNDSEFSYNDVSWSNLIVDDCALFYTVGGPRGMTLHHNWFHDAYSSGTKTKAAGIYLDNDAEGFKVHHNVVWNTEWSNIQINWDGKDIDVFNNTFVDGSQVMGAWHKAGTSFTDVRVWNNLSDDNNWEPQSDKQNNLRYNSDPFVNKSAADFRLKPGSQPIDYGRVIAGVTDGYNGARPDAGAYEFGAPRWVPGIDWNVAEGAAGIGCYGLPGENCADVEGKTFNIPGKVEAEDYRQYFDASAGNAGNEYRNDNVDIQSTTDTAGGYNVGWTEGNEWLEYSINVTEAGFYKADARVASAVGNGMFTLEIDGVVVGSAIEVGVTGGWQSWQTLSRDIGRLSAGEHTLRVQIQSGNFNVNWIDLVRTSAGAALVPGKIEAEDYQRYFDTTPANEGGAYRQDGVDLQATSDSGAGFNVGWTVATEWLEYDIDVQQAGRYTVDLRVASSPGNAEIAFEVDGASVNSRVPVAATGGWQSWTTQSVELGVLTEGTHRIRALVVGGGVNLNWLALRRTGDINQNLLANSSFSSGNLDAWNSSWGGAGTGLDTASGGYYGKVDGVGAVAQVVTGLEANTAYVVSASAKVDVGSVAILGVKEYGGNEKGVNITSTSYEEATLEFTTGNTDSANIYFYIRSAGDRGLVKRFTMNKK